MSRSRRTLDSGRHRQGQLPGRLSSAAHDACGTLGVLVATIAGTPAPSDRTNSADRAALVTEGQRWWTTSPNPTNSFRWRRIGRGAVGPVLRVDARDPETQARVRGWNVYQIDGRDRSRRGAIASSSKRRTAWCTDIGSPRGADTGMPPSSVRPPSGTGWKWNECARATLGGWRLATASSSCSS